MDIIALWGGAKLLLKRATEFVVGMLQEASRGFVEEVFGKTVQKAAAETADELRAQAYKLREEQAEMARKYERDRRRTENDAHRAEEIQAEQTELRSKLAKASASEAINELHARENELSDHILDDDEIFTSVGLLVTKTCPCCQGNMRIRAWGIRMDGKNSSFYWQCTRNPGRCPRVNLDPFKDRSAIVRPADGDLDVDREERRAKWHDPGTVVKTHTRLRGHVGYDDEQVICPTHLTPMRLLPKAGASGLLLGSYSYTCLGVDTNGRACTYSVPVDYMPQVAATLKRTEGVGIFQ